MLLVGLNEEVLSRGIILHSLSQKYSQLVSAIICGVIFGLQHLSWIVTNTSVALGEVLLQCVATGLWGFSMAAVRLRSKWLIPLILIHALDNFMFTLRNQPVSIIWSVISLGGLTVYGVWLLCFNNSKK